MTPRYLTSTRTLYGEDERRVQLGPLRELDFRSARGQRRARSRAAADGRALGCAASAANMPPMIAPTPAPMPTLAASFFVESAPSKVRALVRNGSRCPSTWTSVKRIARWDRPFTRPARSTSVTSPWSVAPAGIDGESVNDDRLTHARRHRRFHLGGLARERRDERQREGSADRRGHIAIDRLRGLGRWRGSGGGAALEAEGAGAAGRLALGAGEGRGAGRLGAGAGASATGAGGGGAGSVAGAGAAAGAAGASVFCGVSVLLPPHPIVRTVPSRAADITCLVIVHSPRTESLQGSGRATGRVNVSHSGQISLGNSTVPEGIARFRVLEPGHYQCLSCPNDYQFD